MGSIAPTTMTTDTNPWASTPLKESSALSRAAGCRIFLKLENLQPSGSFKSRGVGNYLVARLASSPTPSRIHFYCSSGGNAGLACVHAAVSLGRPATVVVPLTTSAFMIAKLQAAGAHAVVRHGASWKEADAYLRAELMAGNPEAVYVPPFDHADIWAGNATMVPELREQLRGSGGDEKPDAVICSVGGGGLFNGVVQGLDEVGWGDVPVLALETKGADSLNASLKAGEHVTLPGITSLAKSLGATRVSDETYKLGQRANVKSVVLEDKEAAMGCWRLADDERIMVELACGVNVALCYDGRLEKVLGKKLGPESKVVIVVCGGSDITVERLYELRKQFGEVEKELPHQSEVPSAQTAPAA